MDEEELYTLKINCNGRRTVEKANKGINVEKYNTFLKIKIIKKRQEKKKKKLHRTAKAQRRGRGF